MFLAHVVPSWHQLEDRIHREVGYHTGAHFSNAWGGATDSLATYLNRLHSVRSAFHQAESTAGSMLRQRFADLNITLILQDLIDVVSQLAMIVVGSTLAGGVMGAGAGALLGGAGAIPLGAAGAAMGLQASGWLLGILGLQSIAEFIVEALPRIGNYYLSGIQTAWDGPRGDDGLNPMMHSDPAAISSAAHSIALGHVEVVVLLLGGIVQYLLRGRGDATRLAVEMRASRRGGRIGQWMVEHQDALKGRPDLQQTTRKGTATGSRPPTREPQRDRSERAAGKPARMPLHEVPCFKADKMPASKIGEFERQLKGQEDGLNRLTVDEYLENIANPIKRSASKARQAREDLRVTLTDRYQREFKATLRPAEAVIAARQAAKKTMDSLAGLHNPDLRAGGRDVIADFGDRQVNSSIGPQWKSKISALKTVAEQTPAALRGSTFLHVKLRKC